VDHAPESARAEELRRLGELARDELEPRDENEKHHRRGAPGFRDDDGRHEPREVVEREPEHRLADHAGGL